MNATQMALGQIEDALRKLGYAKSNLRYARSDQHVPVTVVMAHLEEIRDILADPECTPEIKETNTDADSV